MPHKALTHKEARLACCAACGGKSRSMKPITPPTEDLLKTFAHPEYNMCIESFPVGLCSPCRIALYKCSKARKSGGNVHLKEAWSLFKLENIKVPRFVEGGVCSCPICHLAKYISIEVLGDKAVGNNPVINEFGGKPKVKQKMNLVCPVCLQVTGKGIQHSCPGSKANRLPRSRSFQRSVTSRRSQNLSVLVGRKEAEAQEQIVSSALGRIQEHKEVALRVWGQSSPLEFLSKK